MPIPSFLPIQHRAATTTGPAGQDDQRHSIVWSTGAQVRRISFDDGQEYDEILCMDDGCDLTRLNSGAPVLNSHQSYGLNNVIGVVERAWIKGGVGYGQIRISPRPELAGIRADLASGILKNLSVGYEIREIGIEQRKGRPPLMRVRKWQPLEVSIVPVPADAGAQVLRSATRTFPVRVLSGDHPARRPSIRELEQRILNQVAAGGRIAA